jgi:hypothetical protein
VLSDDRVAVAWQSRDRVYYAFSTGDAFDAKIAAPGLDAAHQNHPTILMNPQGEMLFAYLAEGETLKWEHRSPDGKVKDSGSVGGLIKFSRSSAFLDKDGNFYLAY